MEKNRKWQFVCILTVMALTIYNILPTVFYYLKPLHKPIDAKQSEEIVSQIEERINHLEQDALSWVRSFCDLLHLHPSKIELPPNHPQIIRVEFSQADDAQLFRSRVARAGSLISFGPSRLLLADQDGTEKTVLLQRMIPVHCEKDSSFFVYSAKESPEYNNWIIDRATQVALALIEKNPPQREEIQTAFTQKNVYELPGQNPIFSKVTIDFQKEKINLIPHPHVEFSGDLALSFLGKIHRSCNEKVSSDQEIFTISFHHLPEVSGVLLLDVETIAQKEISSLLYAMQTYWQPSHPDLKELTIVDRETYESLPLEQKALCLILGYSEANHSLYAALKGVERIGRAYEAFPNSPLAESFKNDLVAIGTILYQNGMQKVAIDHLNLPFAADFAFENDDFVSPILKASREDFVLQGSRKYAALDLSTLEQRIIAQNKIETAIHNDLIQWRDDFLAAQVHTDPRMHFDVAPPTSSVFWSNLSLSMKKMIRGDERKIIRWGLDLSGGKTVEIELKDHLATKVTLDADLKQGMNELYNRVNKMGLSEVSIRQAGEHIILDFPGSQSLSASELIKASAMSFHVINEKFSLENSSIGKAVDAFLQQVWEEALFSGKTDAASVHAIAQKRLHQEENKEVEPIKTLISHGLVLNAERKDLPSEEIDDLHSKIVLKKGSSPADWQGRNHPLLIVFADPVLEGSELENIFSSYDPSKGNFLSFGVSSRSATKRNGSFNPQNHLYAWTSRYSKEKILGTPYEADSHGRGWRMAVVLNDAVISAPSLESALKNQAQISGNFSQTEVQRLCSDLKAGSLSFTPYILSEKNVSPELGQTDRIKGISATFIALLLVIGSMLIYYRFAGLVASVAVLMNLAIMWAILQNVGATLTLAGIAGIILTLGMSIDANVLVFERIKEEFALTNRIGPAIHAGYKKAFSAIIDSNVTTIIAALILFNFDAGPIKSFALNLIVGIVSSMFTALFMTRFYFTGWLQNPKHTALKMAHWIKETRFDFLKQTKLAVFSAIVLIGVGSSLLFTQSSTLFGLDFTGGHAVTLELNPEDAEGAVGKVEQAFLLNGATRGDIQVRQMTPSHHLRILFSQGMEEKGKPFFGMALGGQDNPRIDWVIDSLSKNDLALSADATTKLKANWSAVSGQMSDSMRNQALFGFALSFIGIFIYLAFRFEYKFAAAAIGCLIHDVLITLALMGLLHALGAPIQIDLITIAALMTAVGYSLNDTIIIFDRIREEMAKSTKRSLKEIVNNSLNATLSRTMITSGSTLLVVLALLLIGGSSIFGFALVMTIGVVFGTLSSWFIAAPLMLYFHKREESQLILSKNI